MKSVSISEKKGGKTISPEEFIVLLKRNEKNRQWILKQLSQLNIDTRMLQGLPLHQLYTYCEQIFKSTYSIKYLGMNENEMGIISRRLDPFKDSKFSLRGIPQFSYIINQYFYPRGLKVGRRSKKPEDLNTGNLESEIISAFMPKKENKQLFQKKKLTGTWRSLSTQIKSKTFNIKKMERTSNRSSLNDVTKFFNLKEEKKQKLKLSFSRFLSKGMFLPKQP